MSAKYHGKNGVVYMSANGSSAAVQVGGMSGFTVELDADTVDTTEFSAGYETSEIGFARATGNINGFYATDETTLWSAIDAVQSGGYTNLYLYPSSAAPSKYIAAQAWVSGGIATGAKEAVTVTGRWGTKLTFTNKLGA